MSKSLLGGNAARWVWESSEEDQTAAELDGIPCNPGTEEAESVASQEQKGGQAITTKRKRRGSGPNASFCYKDTAQ